jgi:glycosyltransferase involved in cell wall biosynthesis
LIFSNAPWRHYFEEALPLDPDRVRMIETGVDLTVWRHPAARIAKGPGEPVVFALAGSPDPTGGHLDAVRAFSRPELVDRDDWRLRFLGPVDPAVLAPLLASNPRVEIVGPYEPQDLPTHLATADVGLSTSLFATSDRVTREYLLAGLPVVANPTFGNRDLVVDGRNGIMYDRGQADGLARAVCGVLNDRALLERLTAAAAAARPMIRSVDDEMAEIVSLYGEVVKARRGSR